MQSFVNKYYLRVQVERYRKHLMLSLEINPLKWIQARVVHPVGSLAEISVKNS